MTTVDKVHDLFMSFKGRSPRQVYVDACRDEKSKPNSAFRAELSDTPDDFWYMEDLNLAGNYFGGNGCMAILVVVQCQQRLRSLSLRGCGVDDKVVDTLVEILQDHPRLRAVDIGENPNVSVYCGKGLTRAVKLNVNIVDVTLDDTHIGSNVARSIAQRCRNNNDAMELYFSDDYFRMKDMFLGLDVDGSGWVNIKNVVGSVIFPMVKEKLEDRIESMKPRKRDDNCIDVNTFLGLAYLTYKDAGEIAEYCKTDEDRVYQTIRRNWVLLYCGLLASGCMCDEMHKIRIREGELSPEKVEQIIERAKELHAADNDAAAADDANKTEAIEDKKDDDAAEKTAEEGEEAKPVEDEDAEAKKEEEPKKKSDDDDVIHFTAKQLWDAQQGIAPSPLTRKRKSFLLTVVDKPWFMPPSMVRTVVAAFDKAPASGLLAEDVLALTFGTELERLKLGVLKGHFSRYAIPVDVIRLTLVEVVNMFEEYYEVIRVATPVTIDDVKALAEAYIKDEQDAEGEEEPVAM